MDLRGNEYPISNKGFPMIKQEGLGDKLILGQRDYLRFFLRMLS